MDENLTDNQLVFLHLSDIHFRYKVSGESHDLDKVIRQELENDVEYIAKEFSRVDGILVSGDVAFGGKNDEYLYATDWLTKLTKIINCPEVNVFTIPGNHDIDRTVIDEHHFIYDWHQQITATPANVDANLTNALRDTMQGKALFEPLRCYQEFASKYNCFTTPDNPYWEISFPFSQSRKLKIRGINSAILCDQDDGYKPANQLAVGTYQSAHARESGVIYLTMCHHPSGWLMDEYSFNENMLAPDAVPLQLFGHEHNFQVQPLDNALRLYAGAVHPNRGEDGWVPRYNLIRLTTEFRDDTEFFQVQVWVRAWTKNKMFESDAEFCKDGQPYFWEIALDQARQRSGIGSSVRLPDIQPMNDQVISQTAPLIPYEPTSDQNREEEIVQQVDAVQQLVNAFLSLRYHQIASIANKLDLVRDEDREASSTEQYRRYVKRARERPEGFAALWNEIALLPSTIQGKPNPFSIQE